MKLTKAQRGRLEKLAAYLEGLPKRYRHFDMADYYGGDGTRSEADYARNNGGLASCGAVACAVGHGPAAGIRVPPGMVSGCGVLWNDYAALFVGCWTNDAYDWAFHDAWRKVDNSPWGAAARIRYLLANGVPDGFEKWAIKRAHRKLYAPYRIDADRLSQPRRG